HAYASILALQHDYLFGRLVRNMHHWSANLLVLVAFLHLLRVFFTGAFHAPRRLNWIIGLSMLGVALAGNFTGYLLPYDQLAYWAVTVSTRMLAFVPLFGERLMDMVLTEGEIGAVSMRVFYAIHTTLVPGGLILLMAFHFWRIRKNGGVVIPRPPREKGSERPPRAPAIPDLLLRETVTALSLLAVVLLLSVFFNAPLEDPANPGLSPNPTRAPWYFAGLQELLLHIHPTFSVFIIPGIIAGALLYLPFIRPTTEVDGVWFVSALGRKLAVVAGMIALTATPLLIVVDDFFLDANRLAPDLAPIIRDGLAPFIGLVILVAGFYVVMKRRFSATREEAIQAVFILLAGAFIVLTITGAVFRGEGMALGLRW
ncbi:MAG: cytochrome bc complex cytochrome b subunit, partial [Desulfobacterales bacterium]|nr:cytochrome bc complex cytochrome b subunit [Desulfobacterales bacterium]